MANSTTYDHRSAVAALVGALVCWLVLGLAAPARAETTNVTINVPAQVYENTCAGEPVVVHGTLHLVVATTSDGGGGYHVKTGLNTQGMQGQGLISRVPYRAAEVQETVQHVRPPHPTMTSVVHELRLLAQGQVSNLLFSFRQRTVVTADGVPTVTADGLRLSCNG